MRVLVCAITASSRRGMIGPKQIQTIDQALRVVLDARKVLWHMRKGSRLPVTLHSGIGCIGARCVALVSAVPPPRKQYPRRSRPAIDPYIAVIDAILIADQQAPKEQRPTARRIWERLVAEHGVMCSEVTVSRYVAKPRIELSRKRYR